MPAVPPDLRDGVCQVWWARRAPVRPRFLDLLDDAERARAASFLRAADRERFVLGCVVTRCVLGAELSTAPADVRLDRTCADCGRPHGKVRLVAEDRSIQMSVSHSGELIVVAFYRGGPVGVDVERVDPGLDPAELSQHVLTDVESAQLHRLVPAARCWAFTTYWTRKEAIVKATGEGLRAPLSEIAVSPPGTPARLLTRADRPELTAVTRLHDLDPGPGYVAALAVLSEDPVRVRQLEARCWLA